MEKMNNTQQIYFNKENVFLIVPDETLKYDNNNLECKMPKNVIIIKESVFRKVQNFIIDFNLEDLFGAKAEDCTFDTEHWFKMIKDVLTVTNKNEEKDIVNSIVALGFVKIKHIG